ncbi:GNAT family N-acetyltransferase [Acetobacter musti]|uniref:GNAT family N-acetyltransferase n=1 Tax=Acetobacter musti TaxID=864732 RepID=A0ABX0JTJ3_9PROT|nr:GNAT family N-acetyltransferase [Acetobacter musti]
MFHLRPFGVGDFALLAGWFGSVAELTQWGGEAFRFPLTADQLLRMVAEADAAPPARLCRMIEKDGEVAGHAQLRLFREAGGARLCHVAVAPGMRGRGLAVPMLRPVIDEAFAIPETGRVELMVYTWNAPAIRTYERLGFRRESVCRDSVRVCAESWDAAVMALARDAWRSGCG